MSCTPFVPIRAAEVEDRASRTKLPCRDRFMTAVVWIFATYAMIAGALAILFVPVIEVRLGLAFIFLTAPLLICQRQHIQWKSRYRLVHRNLRDVAYSLAMDTHRLNVEHGRLKRHTQRLTAVERRFETVVSRDGKDPEKFKGLVVQNRLIRRETEKLQACAHIQDLLTVILDPKRGMDNYVSKKEMDSFVTYLNRFRVAELGSRKFEKTTLDEEKIRQALKTSVAKRPIPSIIGNDTCSIDERDMAEPERVSEEPSNTTSRTIPQGGDVNDESIHLVPTSSYGLIDVPDVKRGDGSGTYATEDVLLDDLLGSKSFNDDLERITQGISQE